MRHSDETQQEGYFKNAITNQIHHDPPHNHWQSHHLDQRHSPEDPKRARV